MPISTGIKLEPVFTDTDDTTTPFNGDALLQFGQTDPISRVFNVIDKPVRIIAYGLTDGSVNVLRIQPTLSGTNFDGCGNIKGDATGVMFEKPYRVGCKAVKLCAEQDEIVLDAKGAYKVEYVGNDRSSLHVVHQLEPVTVITNNLRGIEDCCDE